MGLGLYDVKNPGEKALELNRGAMSSAAAMQQGTSSKTTGSGASGSQKIGGALSGAVGGAAAGTAVMPGWGTAIGAVIGFLGGLFG